MGNPLKSDQISLNQWHEFGKRDATRRDAAAYVDKVELTECVTSGGRLRLESIHVELSLEETCVALDARHVEPQVGAVRLACAHGSGFLWYILLLHLLVHPMEETGAGARYSISLFDIVIR